MAERVPVNSTMFYNAHPHSEGWKIEHQRQVDAARKQEERRMRRQTLDRLYMEGLLSKIAYETAIEKFDNDLDTV